MITPAKDPAKYVETDIEDETIVMILDTGDFFSLKDSAREIWHLIDGQRDRAAIVDSLAGAFPETARDTLAADVDGFLVNLQETGLLARA